MRLKEIFNHWTFSEPVISKQIEYLRTHPNDQIRCDAMHAVVVRHGINQERKGMKRGKIVGGLAGLIIGGTIVWQVFAHNMYGLAERYAPEQEITSFAVNGYLLEGPLAFSISRENGNYRLVTENPNGKARIYETTWGVRANEPMIFNPVADTTYQVDTTGVSQLRP